MKRFARAALRGRECSRAVDFSPAEYSGPIIGCALVCEDFLARERERRASATLPEEERLARNSPFFPNERPREMCVAPSGGRAVWCVRGFAFCVLFC